MHPASWRNCGDLNTRPSTQATCLQERDGSGSPNLLAQIFDKFHHWFWSKVGVICREWKIETETSKDVCGLAEAKGLPSLIYHELALEVRFVRGAAGRAKILTIRV